MEGSRQDSSLANARTLLRISGVGDSVVVAPSSSCLEVFLVSTATTTP